MAARRTVGLLALILAASAVAPTAQEDRSPPSTGVRGAHERVRNPGRTVTDELGLTVPGTPIDHPARVYPAADGFATGPAVGTRLPDFALPNQRGERIDFHRARAGRRAVVVFIRSAVWCSYCMTQLIELQDRLGEFTRSGFAVYAVSYDPQAALQRFADRYGITFDLLSDAGSVVIRRFGILNTIIDPRDSRAWPFFGIPFPGSYVVDTAGVVTEKYFNRHYATRTSPETILDKALGRVLARPEAPEATRQGRQAAITAFLAGKDLKLEVLNTLHVRIRVPEALHLYGEPLPSGFLPTKVHVRAPDGIRVGAPVYPRAAPRRFDALGVTLNVYDDALDVTVPITRTAGWDALPAARRRFDLPPLDTIDLEVEVHYQACSETLCYRPERIRLSVAVPAADLVYPGN